MKREIIWNGKILVASLFQMFLVLLVVYHVLKYGDPFRDLAAGRYNSLNLEHKI